MADRLQPGRPAKGHLAFRLTQHGRLARRTSMLVQRNMQSPPAELAKKMARKVVSVRKDLHSGPRKIEAYQRMIRLLPVRKGTVVFESHLGKQYDSPRAIYEEMCRRGVPFKAIWSYAG